MLKRPLFTFPLPEPLLQALRKVGYKYYEDLTQGGEWKTGVTDLLLKYNCQPSLFQKLVAPCLVDTAAQLLEKEVLITHIPVLSQSFDEILGGGVPSGTILQLYGGPGSGKTQFLLQICVNVQLPQCFGGLEGSAVFIDTDSAFSPRRLEDIAKGTVAHCSRVAKAHNMEEEIASFNVESILNNVYYLPVGNHMELVAAIERLDSIQNQYKVKFVAIDSLIFPFLTMNNNLERTRILYLIVNKLSLLAEQHNISVVFTNHLTTKIHNNVKELGPALGEAFAHRIPQSLLFAKVGSNFTSVVTKGSFTLDEVARFRITGEGIRDIQDAS